MSVCRFKKGSKFKLSYACLSLLVNNVTGPNKTVPVEADEHYIASKI